MAKEDIQSIDLPWNEERYQSWNQEQPGYEDGGKYVRVDFDPQEQAGRAGTNKPRIATVQELQVAYLLYLKMHCPEKLECKFKALMKAEGYTIVWTPPYCPKMQPIEEFWGVGKGHVARWFNNTTTMKDVIRRLRDGWHGNADRLQPGNLEYTRGTRC